MTDTASGDDAPTDLASRVAGGLVGLLVGDALGVPYEFHPPQDIPPVASIEFAPPPHFQRSHAAVPPGTWSDDGAQALCLLESLLACGRMDAEDFARRLLRWYEHGHLAVDGIVFDVGVATGRALLALRSGVPAAIAGEGASEYSNNGNGSLMRVLPLALWHTGSDEALVLDACLQSQVTHAHPRSQVCCALYCLWARRVLLGIEQPWAEAVTRLRAILAQRTPLLEELEWSVRPDDEPLGQGSGYVVDSLRSARAACAQPDYECTVRAAIAFGRDSDTTACLAGGIAGLRWGLDAIPLRWREALRGGDLYRPLLSRLIEHLAASDRHKDATR